MAAKGSSRPVWSGSISFGLVTIPVKLFVAVREKTLHFRSLHDQDHMPLKQKLVCSADGKEVHREHIVKGYEVEKDHFVIVRQAELDAVAPKSSKAIEIQDFVALGDIDPLYFDKSYYVAPTAAGAKPYQLLLAAMLKADKVGIAKVVMHNKEYLAALRALEPQGDRKDPVLMMETMHFGDEVVSSESVSDLHHKSKVDDRELKVAGQLIDSLTSEFDPGKYHDEYREKVLDLIEQKQDGKKPIKLAKSSEPKVSRGPDLIAALEASLARGKSASSGARTTRRRRSA